MRAVRFIGVGCAATLSDFLIFNLLVGGVSEPTRGQVVFANTSAFACAAAASYLLNARLTFRAQIDHASFARYVAVAIVGAVIYSGSLVALMHAADAESVVALNLIKVVAVALSAVWNFCGFAFFAFRSVRSPASATAQREAGL